MKRFKRGLKRKLSALICTRCGLAGHSDTDQTCPDWEVTELTHYPPLSSTCYAKMSSLLINHKNQECLTKEQRRWREGICSFIESVIKPIYPSAQLVLFGSSANGFGTPTSDLDISMKLPGNVGHNQQSSIVKNLLKHLRKRARRDCWHYNDLEAIPWAKVPIVKMTLSHQLNSLGCDISVGNYMALHNTEMLATYARVDERVQILGIALKQFAKDANMCDASIGSLSSYSYIILLIHYLQQVEPPVVPVLQQIGHKGTILVDNWNCWFYRFDHPSQLERAWPHVGENQSSVGELWVNFFKYYLEKFDWKREVVTIRRLQSLSKLEKGWSHKSACIEDPFNHSRNLAGHLNSEIWQYIQMMMQSGRDHYCDPAFYRLPITDERVFKISATKEQLPQLPEDDDDDERALEIVTNEDEQPRDDIICISSDSEDGNDQGVTITSITMGATTSTVKRHPHQVHPPFGNTIPVYTGTRDGPSPKRQRTVSYSSKDGHNGSASSSQHSSTPFSGLTVTVPGPRTALLTPPPLIPISSQPQPVPPRHNTTGKTLLQQSPHSISSPTFRTPQRKELQFHTYSGPKQRISPQVYSGQNIFSNSPQQQSQMHTFSSSNQRRGRGKTSPQIHVYSGPKKQSTPTTHTAPRQTSKQQRGQISPQTYSGPKRVASSTGHSSQGNGDYGRNYGSIDNDLKAFAEDFPTEGYQLSTGLKSYQSSHDRNSSYRLSLDHDDSYRSSRDADLTGNYTSSVDDYQRRESRFDSSRSTQDYPRSSVVNGGQYTSPREPNTTSNISSDFYKIVAANAVLSGYTPPVRGDRHFSDYYRR